jgi:hypothetical protein
MTAQTEHRLKVALWLVPIIFSVGAFYSMTLNSTAHIEAELEEVVTGLAAHSALKAHPVTEERINTIMLEQRAIRDEQTDQGRSLAAICQATGARCQ